MNTMNFAVNGTDSEAFKTVGDTLVNDSWMS